MRASGKLLETGRYIVNVATLVDSIVAGSDLRGNPDDPHYWPWDPLTVRAANITGLHLWRDTRISEQAMFMSKELFDVLNEIDRLRIEARPLTLV